MDPAALLTADDARLIGQGDGPLGKVTADELAALAVKRALAQGWRIVGGEWRLPAPSEEEPA